MRRTTEKPKRAPRTPGFRRMPRGCRLCKESIKEVNYKDAELLQKFITERGKIMPSRITGNCASHQRKIANAIKRARIAAILPFVAE
jgi:small subunit ribosomal protein S18